MTTYQNGKGKAVGGRVVDGEVTYGSHRSRSTDETPDDLVDGILQDLLDSQQKKQESQQQPPGGRSGGTGAKKDAKSILARIRKNRAEAKWEEEVSTSIEIRKEGFLQRPNAIDRARDEALKANKDRLTLIVHGMKNVETFAGFSKLQILQTMRRLIDLDNELPEDLQPLGELLTERSLQALLDMHEEGLVLMLSQTYREIVEAMEKYK